MKGGHLQGPPFDTNLGLRRAKQRSRAIFGRLGALQAGNPGYGEALVLLATYSTITATCE